MRILRKCEVCGEEFIATKITNKYCSKRCARVVHRKKEAEKKKKARESKKDDAQNLQSLEIASRPFLTPSDVAFLLGVSVTTVYRCFYSGTLKAVRLRRKTYVRREDLDKYFEEAGAYKKKSYKRKDDQEYYTLREIMEKYNIGRKAVWGRCDRLGIPKVYVGRNTFFSKKAVDAKFADLLEEIDLDNYYTMDQVMEMYGMTRTNAMSFVTYHKVPRVNYHVAIKRARRVKVPSFPKIELHHYTSNILEIGVMEKVIDGFKVKVYDVERCVCDAVKFRNKVGIDVCSEIIDNYLSRPERNISKLMDYARQLRVGNILENYLQVKL